MFKRLFLALAAPAVVLVLCGVAGAVNTYTFGPFNVSFYDSTDAPFTFNGGFYGSTTYTPIAGPNGGWTATQIADVGNAIQAWVNRIDNPYGTRQINVAMLWDTQTAASWADSAFIYSGGRAYTYPEYVWRQGGSQSPAGNIDIVIPFNPSPSPAYGPWFFNDPAPIPLGSTDFSQVVCHELGHTLGFVSTFVPSTPAWWANGITTWDSRLRDDLGNIPYPGAPAWLGSGPRQPTDFNVVSNPCYFVGPSSNAYLGGGSASVQIVANTNGIYNGVNLVHLNNGPNQYLPFYQPNPLMNSVGYNGYNGPVPLQPTPLECTMMQDLGWIIRNNWNNAAADLNWGNAGNWDLSVVPQGNSVYFTNAGLVSGDTVLLGGASWTIFSLTINSGVAFTLGGDPGSSLTITSGNITSTPASAGSQTIASPVLLGANGTWNVSGTGQLIVSGAISGNANLTKTGGGTLRLSNPGNSYIGATTISNGFLQLGASEVIPNASDVTVNGTFDLAGFTETVGSLSGTGNINVPSASQLIVGSNNTSTSFSGQIIGLGGLTKIGTGTLTISGPNSYSGGTTIYGGALQLGSSAALSASTVLTVNGGVMYLGGFNPSIGGVTLINGLITGGGSLTSATAFDLQSGTVSAVLAGSAGVNKSGPGTVTLSGADNTFSGNILISQGTLSISRERSLGAVPGSFTADQVTVAGGATLRFIGPMDVNGNRGITLGATTGTSSTFDTQTSGLVRIYGTITGIGGLTKTGTGSLGIYGTGGNTYNGDTTVLQGSLSISNPNSIPNGSNSSGTGNVYIASGASINLNAQNMNINGLNGSGSITYPSWTSGTSRIVNLGYNNANGSFSGAITEESPKITGLVKVGAGTQTLSGGSSNYSGTTTVNAGILAVAVLADGGQLSSIGASSNAAANLVLNGGTLQFIGSTNSSTDHAFTLGNNGGTLDAWGTGVINWTSTTQVAFSGAGARTLTLTGSNGGDNILTPLISDYDSSDPTSLVKSGVGKWILAQSETYTGNTTVLDGALDALNIDTPDATVSVADGEGNTLLVASIVCNTLSIGAGATIVIKPIPGGPLVGSELLTPIPEPSTCVMLMLAAMGLGIYWRRCR